ncbi:MAG: hypothetical protein PHO91_02480 [Patescibacteria group bacterium]|nr:hypothetical protein [Patescibacteria group bacterium]
MAEKLDFLSPQLEQEGEIKPQEALELAEKALLAIEQANSAEDFPGADAYRKVMRAVVMAGADDKVIANWQDGYEELEAKYKGGGRAEFLQENNIIEALQGALDSAQRKIEESGS